MKNLNKQIDCGDLGYEQLSTFLKKYHDLSSNIKKKFQDCINEDPRCWAVWNQVRWDAAKNTQGYQELKDYLDEDFQVYFDSSLELANRWKKNNDRDLHHKVRDFYKTNDLYLYNLVIWHESGQRYRLKPIFRKFKKRFNLRTAIDFGCGVGTDTLSLLELGYQVFSIDFDCPSVDFLKWRLRKRGLSTNFLDTQQLEDYPDVDLFIAIDVLEHMPDPLQVFKKLSDQTKVVMHISQFNDQAGGRHPFHFDFQEEKIDYFLLSKGYYLYKSDFIDIWFKRELL